MADILAVFVGLSYFGVVLLLFLVNVAPALMPPTWLILASFYVLDDSLNPLFLAIAGATGSTAGRFVLLYSSAYFRRFMNQERKSSLEKITNYLKSKRYGFFLVTCLFAATPLPSNMLFIGYGLMKAKTIQIYIGFWLGRILSYYVMISISKIVLTPFTKLFEDRLLGIIVADILSVAVLAFFASINWNVLITEKKIRFVKPKLWRL